MRRLAPLVPCAMAKSGGDAVAVLDRLGIARYGLFGGEREMPMHLASYCLCSFTRRDDGLFRPASAAASRFSSSSSCAHTDEPRGSAGAPSGIASGLAPRAQGVSVYVVRPEASWHL